MPFKALSRRRFFGAVTGAVGLACADAVFEPHTLDVTRHEVGLPNLPRALDGYRVALLSDLHRGELTPDQSIVDAVQAALDWKPDAVALTGDFVRGKGADAEPCAQLLAPLKAIPSVGCLGNHDYYFGTDAVLERRLAELAGVRMLRNGSWEAAPGLYFAGIEDTLKGVPDPKRALAGVPQGAAVVFLTHNPVGVRYVMKRPCVALSGHTHGGQVRVPGLAPHFPPGMDGFPLIEGWGMFGDANLFISRGVGQTGYGVRLCCPPEVALLTFRCA